MKEYNSAFFGLYENIFNTIAKRYNEEEALSVFAELMKTGLGKAYGDDFQKGNTDDFARVVGDRDNNVGLKVTFHEISDKKIVYRFHDDPFPNLKGVVDANKLVDTYINFKVKHLLGDDWSYIITKHLWRNDEYTEIVATNP